MGGAMLRAWLDRGYDPRKISVIEPRPSREVFELAESKGFALGPPSRPPQVLVLAMKPQNLDEAAAGLAPFASRDTLVVSILAGKTIANVAARLPQAKAIVRAMPNLAAAVGRGMAVLAANAAATPDQRAAAEALLAAMGRVRMACRRGFDRCGDRRVGFRSGLCLLSRRSLGKCGGRPGSARRIGRAAGAHHGRRRGRIIVPMPGKHRGGIARKCDVARRDDRCRP